ncbi:transglycosylase SLT domain-containing protein [Melissococcus plutonius]|uniref:transglycosylase SLT domain-containing protein n=1 Tax=Melissococcus plutonius TaxID=33970 RepID=UPI003C2DB6D6
MRSLRSEVKQVTDEWKLQNAQLRQNGDYEEAYQTKVNGLEKAIQKQKQGIDQLKQTMAGIPNETKAGADAHDKLAQELLKAERNLQNLSEQQEKAKKTLELYETGILQTRRELEQSEKVSQSYQDKLRAEGKELEANKEQHRFLAEKIKTLSSLQEKENDMLEKIHKNSGETSDAYKKQAVRVNDLGTKIAHSKTEMQELDKAMGKKPKLNLDGAIKKLEDLNSKAEGTHHMFGKIMGAELISRAAIAGLQNIKSGLTDALKAGMEFNEEQQVMSATWNTLTNDAGKAQGMVKTINDLSVATGRSRDLVNELEQGFYHLHSDKKESDNLTKSMLNMGDAVGLTDDKIQTVTQDMVHGLSSGKLSLQELNQLGQYFPMFTEQMAAYVQQHKQATDDSSKDSKEAAKAQKAYVKEMTAQFEAMHYGSKISQQDIQDLGQKSILSGDQVKKFTAMQQSGQAITTSMIKQAIRVNSAYAKSTTDSKQQVAESSDDAVKHLRDLVHQGKVSAAEVEEVFNHLGQDKYGKAADNMLQTMSGMKRTVASQVPALVGAFEKPILNAKNPFYGAVSKWVSDQKTQDKFTKMGEAAQKGVDTILKAFGKVFAKGSTVNIADGLLDWITQKITDMSNWIANHANQIVDFFKKTKDVVVDLFNRGKETLSGFYDIAKPFLDLIKKYPKQFGELIGAMYLAKPAIEGVTIALKGFQMFKTVGSWIKDVEKKLKDFSKIKLGGLFSILGKGGAVESIGSMTLAIGGIAVGIAAIGAAAFLAYKKIKPFHDWVDKLIHKLVELGKSILKSVIKSFDSLSNQWSDWWSKNGKPLEKAFSNFAKDLGMIFRTPLKMIRSLFSSTFKGIFNEVKIIIKGITGIFSGGLKSIEGLLEIFTGVFTGNWSKAWDGVKDIFKGGAKIVSSIFDTFKDTAVNIAKTIGEGLGNAIIDGINGLINGVDWVSKKLTGHATTIHHLKHIKLEQGTQHHAGGLALINDAKGADYQEMVIPPHGQPYIPVGRNVLTNLEAGTQVIPGHITKSLLDIPRYEKGTGFWTDLWDNTKNLVGDIFDYTTHPKKLVNIVVNKFASIKSGSKEVMDLGWGTIKTLAKEAVGYVQKLFDSDNEHSKNAPTSGPPGEGVQRWKDLVKKALDANGLSTSGAMIDKVLRQIQTESSGNPNAKQPGADPDGDGSGPALGLMQTKRSTFDAYKFPGHGNIFDGYDNLLAALKYAKARYGSDLSFLGQGHGYANGGWADKPSIFGEVKNEPEVAINPKRSTADHLIIEAMQARAKMAPNSLSADMVQMMTNTKTLPLHAGMQSVAMLYKAKENLDTSTHNVQPANSDQSELIALAKGQLRELTEQNTFLRKILDAVLTTDNNNNNNNNSGYHVLLKQMQKDQALNAWQY